jgi:predicted DNA-binding transcriptional regulator AlpA
MHPIPDNQTYMPAGQVLRRYGRRNLVWLWRLLRNDPTFPKPLFICNQRYWLISDLEAWEASKRQVAA